MQLERIYNRLESIGEQYKDITFTFELYDVEDNLVFKTSHFESIEQALEFLHTKLPYIDLAKYRLWLNYSIDNEESEFLADVIFTIINGEFGYQFV